MTDRAGEGVLYAWPEATRFGRKVPKSKVYDAAGVPNRVKRRFIDDVDRIVWAHKLSADTVGLPATDEVTEIQVLAIHAKGDEVADDVLVTIDRAIPSALIFEIERDSASGQQVRTAVLQSHREASRTNRTVHSSDWVPTATERVPLPRAIDLASLYAGLIAPLLPVRPVAGESLDDTAARSHRAERLQRDIDRLVRQIARERHFKRKVDLRREVRDARAELERLMESPMGASATDEG